VRAGFTEVHNYSFLSGAGAALGLIRRARARGEFLSPPIKT